MLLKFKDPNINRFTAGVPGSSILIWKGPPGTVPLVAIDTARMGCQDYQPNISIRQLPVGTEVLSNWDGQWHGAVVIEP